MANKEPSSVSSEEDTKMEVLEEEEKEEKEEEEPKMVPDLELAGICFRFGCLESVGEGDAVWGELLGKIESDAMCPLYELVCEQYGMTKDDALIERMGSLNQAAVVAIDEELADAEKNHGDMEILDAMFKRAEHYARIGARESAYDAIQAIISRPKTSIGKRIEASMLLVRMALFHLHNGGGERLKGDIENVTKLIDEGGDWDKRNRLKVYEALFCIHTRDFDKASELLLASLATFTATEVCGNDEFIMYSVLSSMMSLKRTDLKEKVVDSSDVITAIGNTPGLENLLDNLYQCRYREFFAALLNMETIIQQNRYTASHMRYIVREMRVLSYSQYLDAYQSVTLANMAASFGVDEDFMDRELARFISVNRISAKIDKVAGVVETNRPDAKNAQYNSIVKNGDALLNRIQKLARVIDF